MASPLTTVGLFAGIGGIELGFERAGLSTAFLCESWLPARAVLSERFPDRPLAGDIRALRSLPKVDVVAAGFPCQDLSQAGRTAGIDGGQSGLVGEAFRLLRRRHPTWLVFENVRFMLQLDRGRAMRVLTAELESMKYRWAYRVVDSRFTGVPQRRQRVLLVASRTEDPREVLFADDAGPRPDKTYREDGFGFYWTEGLRGLGWAVDAVPTLKGGSTIGISSPPAIWLPKAQVGKAIALPSIRDGEVLQGFPRGWTDASDRLPGSRRGVRWKLVGNAVTVSVAKWLGQRLSVPGAARATSVPLESGSKWPDAAWGERGRAYATSVSHWPRRDRYMHLTELLDDAHLTPLSMRGVAGFHHRLLRGGLVVGGEEFRLAVKQHLEAATYASTE